MLRFEAMTDFRNFKVKLLGRSYYYTSQAIKYTDDTTSNNEKLP